MKLLLWSSKICSETFFIGINYYLSSGSVVIAVIADEVRGQSIISGQSVGIDCGRSTTVRTEAHAKVQRDIIRCREKNNEKER